MNTLLPAPAEGKHSIRFFFTALLVCMSVTFFAGNSAVAQCDTFYNADAANQILNTYPAPFYGGGVAFTDLDNDGDFDCYVTASGSLLSFENKGNARHPLFDYNTLLKTPDLGSYTPENNWHIDDDAFTDIDGDGDADFFITQDYFYHAHGSFAFRFFTNTGTAAMPVFSESTNPLPKAIIDSFSRGGSFTFYDVDGDGDPDFTYVTFTGALELYLNTGCKTAAQFTYYSTLATVASGKPAYYDWNHDGKPDLFVNGQLYLNNGTASPSFTVAAAGPVFNNGAPAVMIDLNNDGAVEAYSQSINLSTLVPVPVIDTAVQKIGNYTFVKYYSHQLSPGYIYNWSYNSKRITGYHKPFIFAEKEGIYSLEITGMCGTGVSLPHFTYNRNVFAVNAAKENMAVPSQQLPGISVKVFPNPFANGFTVTLPPANTGEKTRVTLTDMAGRRQLSLTATEGSITLGHTLQKGMYVLQVWQDDKVIYHRLVEKQ